MNRTRADLHRTDPATAVWRKSSHSAGENNCVEIADLPGQIWAVRDSKHPGRQPLRFTARAWEAFRKSVVTGEL
ncbi:DUF397 domain-containing protein [Streptomyces sp. B1866]|uniref:DUF397 domain-containing protein n=1 Tax=Streptomyces sp. B1866 TaxID=3075431 RepID=UPI00288CB6D5|nr:DUF397 domain-containing protein [Streptomyces sp. B1866]MDT3399829.1 DUF397 domain-containing protein [Streptomyces sp. B1866]